MVKTTMRKLGLMSAVSVFSLQLACTETNPAYEPDPYLPDQCREGVEFTETFRSFERPEKLDLLFVIDNSGDVDDMQRALSSAAPALFDALDGIDIQVAVATTAAAGEVAFAPPGTSLDGCDSNDVLIAHSESSGFIDAVKCNLVQGTGGDKYQQALNVIDSLLFDVTPEELRFFRSDARIAMVIVSNEDDCSTSEALPADGSARENCAANADKLRDIDAFVTSLRGTSVTREGVRVAAISGPPASGGEDDLRAVCSSRVGASYSAPRLFGITQALGDQGYFTSLCVEDLEQTMRSIGESFVRPADVTLCASKAMTHEPLAVTAVSDTGRTAIRLGEGGFTFLGQTSDCGQGAMEFSASAVENLESVEVKYCVEAP